MNSIRYTQENFDRDIKSLVKQLRGKKFDLIIGINRGGCLPAVCLSHALKTPATMVDWSTRDGANISPKSIKQYFQEISSQYKTVLIVDDLIDSGRAMKELLAAATPHCMVTVATLLHNTDVDLGVVHYFGTAYSRKIETRYYDFWWEMYGV